MNTIFIVLPILTLLMFDLGLTLKAADFLLVFRRPKPVLIGLTGQILVLPAVAVALAEGFSLPALFYIGLVLVACSPGGSSSNVFSMLAKGDVALSVSLTALSSVVTLFTTPLILGWVTAHVGEASGISLPVGNLLVQNVFTMLVPIVAGITVRKYLPRVAEKTEKVLTKCAFPALMFLAAVFFLQHRTTIASHISTLGFVTTSLILLAIIIALLGCMVFRLKQTVRRTIIIEVGMQNAAQAIAIASSPYVFNDGRIAIPAIIYALMMNVVLLLYVGFIKRSIGREVTAQ